MIKIMDFHCKVKQIRGETVFRGFYEYFLEKHSKISWYVLGVVGPSKPNLKRRACCLVIEFQKKL